MVVFLDFYPYDSLQPSIESNKIGFLFIDTAHGSDWGFRTFIPFDLIPEIGENNKGINHSMEFL